MPSKGLLLNLSMQRVSLHFKGSLLALLMPSLQRETDKHTDLFGFSTKVESNLQC